MDAGMRDLLSLAAVPGVFRLPIQSDLLLHYADHRLSVNLINVCTPHYPHRVFWYFSVPLQRCEAPESENCLLSSTPTMKKQRVVSMPISIEHAVLALRFLSFIEHFLKPFVFVLKY
jgi:hypothetical protein